jgi:hypothetical protein
MILKRTVLTLVTAAACACALAAPALASTSASISGSTSAPASGLPAGLLAMASSWTSPDSGIVLGYPSRDTGAKPYLLATGNAGKTWRTLPAPPVTYPADNDQPDAVWSDCTIVVTDGTHIEFSRDNGTRWTADRTPGGGLYIDKLVIADGRLFALLTSTSRAALYWAPLTGGALRPVSGVSVSSSLAYGDITGVGTLQVDLGGDYTTQRYWYSRDGVHFVSAPRPCPVSDDALLGGVRDGKVIALCDTGPSQVTLGETQIQVAIAPRLGAAFGASGPLTDSPNDLEFAAASPSDMTVATFVDLGLTRDAGKTWTPEIPQNNGVYWSDLSFSTATTGTVVGNTVNNKGGFVGTVYRTTNAGVSWAALKL